MGTPTPREVGRRKSNHASSLLHKTHPMLSTMQVVVCNVMTSGAGINRRAGLAKRLNRQLSLYVRQAEAKADASEQRKDADAINRASPEPVRLAKLNNPRSSRDDGRAFDGLHLNAKGYKSFAADLYDVLGPMMVAVEWKIWKRHLAGEGVQL